MYACPWCGTKSFSFWQKQMLGPKRSLVCGHCSRKVSVRWDRAQLAAIPVIALGFLGLLVGRAMFGTWAAVFLFGWLGTTMGMGITAPLYHLFVPLVKPE
jgi:hypothetical protein